MKSVTAVALVLALFLSRPTESAKILLVVGNINSHVLYFARFADDLARLGHVTELLAPSNSRRPDFVAATRIHANFTYTEYEVDGAVPFANSPETSGAFLRIALSRSTFERFQILSSFAKNLTSNWEADCARLLANDRLMERLRTGGFQFAVMDPLAVHCYFVLPYSLDIPYAMLSASVCAWFYRVPRLPSFVSSSVGYSDRMSFVERLKTLLFDLATAMTVSQSTEFSSKYAPGKPPLSEMALASKASAWFFMEDVAVGYALPQMPNTAAVGDVMAGRPGRPLPADLETFLRASANDVIVVSFGSYFDHVPRDVTDKLCDAFRRLGASGRRVVWKFRDARVCETADRSASGYLLTMPWIPQNDLLADRRVRLFITHGGLNSLVEGIYHAKPLVVFPIAVDQPYNAAAAVSKGFAVQIDIGDFTADDLVRSVETVLTEPSYRKLAELSSAVMRDRRDTPAERMSHMVEHVIKYGDGHLKTGAYELNVLEFFMFDVFAFIFASGLFALVITFLTCRYVCSRCVRSVCRRSHERQKSKAD